MRSAAVGAAYVTILLCVLAWKVFSPNSLPRTEMVPIPLQSQTNSSDVLMRDPPSRVFPVTRLDGSRDDCAAIRRSLKYSPRCSESPGEAVWPVLITSVGSSGTKYMALLLRKLGFEVSHDNGAPGRDGAVSWALAFNNDSAAYPNFVGNISERGRFKKVLLQVRDPIKVINSRLAGGGLGEWFVDQNTAVQRSQKVYTPARSVEHWLSWNLHVLRYSDWNYRLEDVDIGELCRQAGFGSRCPSKSQIEEAKASLPQTTHHHEHNKKQVTWNQLAQEAPLVTELAMDLGSLFGYNLSSAVPAKKFFSTNFTQQQPRKLRATSKMVEVRCIVDFCEVVRVYWR